MLLCGYVPERLRDAGGACRLCNNNIPQIDLSSSTISLEQIHSA